jgi:hypothetical protein
MFEHLSNITTKSETTFITLFYSELVCKYYEEIVNGGIMNDEGDFMNTLNFLSKENFINYYEKVSKNF